MKLVLDLVTLEGCKAELTCVVYTSQDSLHAKDGNMIILIVLLFSLVYSMQSCKPDIFDYVSGNTLYNKVVVLKLFSCSCVLCLSQSHYIVNLLVYCRSATVILLLGCNVLMD